ncbi:hypothetical protein CAEBREN_24714 [Caenorhabditis brenneri]|uniref:Uncharacterized protein n=1 Tax=Caenorhabditis brenneri TaxID=135651 RepID=G0MYG0_CAEBE|nr:hypothetical protein CAEBREN_24714 [Caenorhabditis brenneri]
MSEPGEDHSEDDEYAPSIEERKKFKRMEERRRAEYNRRAKSTVPETSTYTGTRKRAPSQPPPASKTNGNNGHRAKSSHPPNPLGITGSHTPSSPQSNTSSSSPPNALITALIRGTRVKNQSTSHVPAVPIINFASDLWNPNRSQTPAVPTLNGRNSSSRLLTPSSKSNAGSSSEHLSPALIASLANGTRVKHLSANIPTLNATQPPSGRIEKSNDSSSRHRSQTSAGPSYEPPSPALIASLMNGTRMKKSSQAPSTSNGNELMKSSTRSQTPAPFKSYDAQTREKDRYSSEAQITQRQRRSRTPTVRRDNRASSCDSIYSSTSPPPKSRYNGNKKKSSPILIESSGDEDNYVPPEKKKMDSKRESKSSSSSSKARRDYSRDSSFSRSPPPKSRCNGNKKKTSVAMIETETNSDEDNWVPPEEETSRRSKTPASKAGRDSSSDSSPSASLPPKLRYKKKEPSVIDLVSSSDEEDLEDEDGSPGVVFLCEKKSPPKEKQSTSSQPGNNVEKRTWRHEYIFLNSEYADRSEKYDDTYFSAEKYHNKILLEMIEHAEDKYVKEGNSLAYRFQGERIYKKDVVDKLAALG